MSEAMEAKNEAVVFEEKEPGIGLVTMNRPDKLNAVNIDMVEALEGLYERLSCSHEIRVVILTGAGRGFCSGADLQEAVTRARDEVFATPYNFLKMVQERFANLVLGLRRIPQPVIAAVNGPAAGGGFAFALASDIRVAAPEAYFVASFINLGLSGGEMGTSYLLPRFVGLSRASEILYTGRRVPAGEAEKIGLVNMLVPKEELVSAAMGIARTMLGKSHGGLALTKRILDENASACSLASAMEVENRNQTILAASSEFFQSVRSFTQ